jgi:hypothetical protein
VATGSARAGIETVVGASAVCGARSNVSDDDLPAESEIYLSGDFLAFLRDVHGVIAPGDQEAAKGMAVEAYLSWLKTETG